MSVEVFNRHLTGLEHAKIEKERELYLGSYLVCLSVFLPPYGDYKNTVNVFVISHECVNFVSR